MKFFFICFIICFKVQAQKNVTLESSDGLVTVTNYIAFDETLDSVVIKHKSSKLSLFDNSFCENSKDEACEIGASGVSYISDIEILDDTRYLLTSMGRYPDGNLLDIIVYNKKINDIDKWLVANSSNRFLNGINFYYQENENMLFISKLANEIEDEFIYDVDYKENTFKNIAAVEKKFRTFVLNGRFGTDKTANNLFYEVLLDNQVPIKLGD